MYDATVMHIVEGLRPSGGGELEITDVNNAYLREGALHYGTLQGSWTDVGTPQTLALPNRLPADIRLDLFETRDHRRSG